MPLATRRRQKTVVFDEKTDAQPPSAPQIHAQLRVKAEDAVDLAALAHLRMWELGDLGYTAQELVEMAGWLESKLTPAKTPSQVLWRKFRRSSLSRSACVVLGVVFAIIAFCVLIAAGTGLALEVSKVLVHRNPGVLAAPVSEQPAVDRVVSTGVAVRLHGLMDYPSLPNEELRRVTDVTFKHQGAMYFFRVASVTRLMNGGVRLVAQDGTIIRVQGDRADMTRPWQPEEVLNIASAGGANPPWDSAGAFVASDQYITL